MAAARVSIVEVDRWRIVDCDVGCRGDMIFSALYAIDEYHTLRPSSGRLVANNLAGFSSILIDHVHNNLTGDIVCRVVSFLVIFIPEMSRKARMSDNDEVGIAFSLSFIPSIQLSSTAAIPH